MGDFLRIILDSIAYLWPFRLVHEWEKGGYYVVGRYKGVVGPGLYPIVPFFTDCKVISVVAGMVETPRHDITVGDGSLLSFSASAYMRVTDYNLAVNAVEDFHHATQLAIGTVLSDKLADVDPARLAPEKRGRLLSDLARWVQDETAEYGIGVEHLRFTSFVTKTRAIRLLTER